jgi:hypothetical protein
MQQISLCINVAIKVLQPANLHDIIALFRHQTHYLNNTKFSGLTISKQPQVLVEVCQDYRPLVAQT